MLQDNLTAGMKDISSTPSKNSSPYLGQTPPGDTPVIFAQGIISTGNVHSRLSISPDGKDMFWTVFTKLSEEEYITRIMHTVDENGIWTKPHSPVFAENPTVSGHFFSSDGNKLYFTSAEENGPGRRTKYVEKTDTGWSEPQTDGFVMKPSLSLTNSGVAYFSDHFPGKPWNSGIFCGQLTESGYINIRPMDSTFNSPYMDYTPYISPEGDCLLFSSSRPSMAEEMFLHISFKTGSGTWSTPEKMNEKLGYSGNGRFPSISPDGKYIFFCGDDGNIYWVNRNVVGRFRP